VKAVTKPLFALCLLSPVMGEIVSSNVLPSLFVRQPVMLLFAALTYSVPVLLLRELAVARRLSLWGVLTCGLAYGLFNEGLLARTIFRTQGLPIPVFDGYLIAGGLSLGWAATMLVWHAMFSVATPMIVVHSLWPEHATTRWLPRRAHVVGVALCVASSLLLFRTDEGVAPGAASWAALTGAIVALVFVGQSSRGALGAGYRWVSLLVGLGSFALFGGLFLLAGLRAPVGAFLAYLFVVSALFSLALRRLGGELAFFVGASTAFSLFVFLAKQRLTVEGNLVSLSLAVALVAVLRGRRRAT
jgi:hypothetical protein